MNDVCSVELLANAVANRLTADEEAALYDHLELCESCCARMEQLAGGEQWQQEAASLLTTDELDAAVPEPMVWSEVDFSVEHLEPSEDVNVLGQLGGYDVLAIIGRGGMGVVLKAFDRELKRFVAIKALSPHLAHSSVARKRFAREAQAAAAVVNPHVIAIHHVQPTGRLPFLIMPLLTGESLAQRLKSRAPLELTEVLRIGMQAAVGLAAAHDQGLVHRDVKPANIFLEKGVERVVITDFGLARAADDISMTRMGVVAGTPEYMSPEQARGEALDGRSDLFSLGCVLYEMATGVSPFRSDSTIATLRRIVDEKPAAIASLAPELPPWFSYIVERLLSKDPAQRFASASEVSLLLEQCLSHLQQPTSVPLPASLMPHANGRRSIFSANRKGMLTMLGTLGMALLGMVLWQSTDPPDISGQWTSDEWGIVVLETKEPGVYEGTFTGFGQDKRTQSNSSLGGVDPATLGLRINVPSMGPEPLGVDFLVVGPDGLGMSPKSAADPMGVDKGTAETDLITGVPFRDLNTVDTTTGKVDSKLEGNFSGMSGFAFRGLDKNSGTLHLKWLRLERRFNGTWGQGADRRGTMSLRLVDKEIRGGWTTDEGAQLESGTPLLGDLVWNRAVVTVPDGGTVLLGGLKNTSEPGGPEDEKPKLQKPLDRQNARSVVEAFVAAAIAGDGETGRNLARDLPQEYVSRFKEILGGATMTELPIQSVYVNDLTKPTRAIAISETVPVHAQHSGTEKRLYMVLTLIMSEEGWSVFDVTHEDEVQDNRRRLKKFLDANPNAVRVSAKVITEAAKSTSGLTEPPFSLDSAFADVDYSGDLDVVSRVNRPATILPPEPQQKSGANVPLAAFGRPHRVLSVSQVLKEGPALEKSQEIVGVRFRVAAASPETYVTGDRQELRWVFSSEKKPYEIHPLAFTVSVTTKVLEELGAIGLSPLNASHLVEDDGHLQVAVERISKYFVGKVIEVEGSVESIHSFWDPGDTRKFPRYAIRVNDLEQIKEVQTVAPIVIDDSKTLDRENIRSVIEVYVIAALQGDHTTAASVAIVQGKPADPNQIEPQIQAISRSLNVKQLAMHSIHLNDIEKPTQALAISESVTLSENKEDRKQTRFVMLELTTVGQEWFVTDVEIQSEEAANDQLKKFLEANPNSIDLPPMRGDSASVEVDETLQSLIESLKPIQGDWVVESLGPWFYPADKLGDSAVSHFVMRIQMNHVGLRPFPHSGEQPVSKLLLHPIQDAKPGHFLVDTDPSAVDQRFSPGEVSFEVQDNQLQVKLIPAKPNESNPPDQGSEAPTHFSARRATDEEQRKFAQNRFQHMRMAGYKNPDRTNPEAVVEAYVAASLAGDVAIATSLAEGYAARPDQSTGWNKHWNLNNFAIKSVRVRGRVVTPMRVTAKEAIVVSELMHRTSPATTGDVSIGHHVAFLKNINGKWVVSAFDLWTAEHYNKGIGNFLNADGQAIGVPQEDVEGTSEKRSAGHIAPHVSHRLFARTMHLFDVMEFLFDRRTIGHTFNNRFRRHIWV